jgi:hypothetical protein
MTAILNLAAADEEITRLKARIATLEDQIIKDDALVEAAGRLVRDGLILTPARRGLVKLSYDLVEAVTAGDPEGVDLAQKAVLYAAVLCGRKEQTVPPAQRMSEAVP